MRVAGVRTVAGAPDWTQPSRCYDFRHADGGGGGDREGAFGASTAYHLARRGADVVLVDQHAMGSQTSARAAGLTSKTASTPVMAALRHEACEAFERFESELGRSVDFHRSGSLKATYTEGGEARLRADFAVACRLGHRGAVDLRRQRQRPWLPTSSRAPPSPSATCRRMDGSIPPRSP